MRLLKSVVAFAVCAGLVLAVARGAVGQEKKDEKKPAPKPAEIKPKEGQTPGEGAEDEMMKMMMEAGAPGPHHEHLKFFVGQWKATVKSWMSGPGEPTVSEGTSTIESIHGGRFTKETFKGNFMDMPFDGLGLMGYDNVSKKHIGLWSDNFGTGFAISEGTCDPSGKVFTYTTTCNDPQSGKPQTSKSVVKITDENSYTFTMSGAGPDGKEFTMMEITYKRM